MFICINWSSGHLFLPIQNLKCIFQKNTDGGLARLKVYGTMLRDWSLSGLNHLSDLAAMVNGGTCVGYSDAQLGHPQNILGKNNTGAN